jgi:hypothetical protein
LKNLSFSPEHLNEALIKVYNRDQQYWDSLYNPALRNRERRFNRPMWVCDSINQKIVEHILDHQGWPKGMTEQANLGLFLTILHSSDKVFLPHVRDGFNKRIITSQYYATLIDIINVRNYGKQLFGTYLLLDKNGEGYFPPGISLSVDSTSVQNKL